LHEFDEFDFGGVLSPGARRRIGMSGCRTLPAIPPRLAEFVPEHLEAGKVRQQVPRSARNASKILLAGRLGVALKSSKSVRSARHIQDGDADVNRRHRLPATAQRLARFRNRAEIREAFSTSI